MEIETIAIEIEDIAIEIEDIPEQPLSVGRKLY
jgi:hypothetical protein